MTVGEINIAIEIEKVYKKGLEQVERDINKTVTNINKSASKIKFGENLQKSFKNIGTSFKNVGDQISGVGKSLLPVTAGITALGVGATKSFIDFEDQMANVQKTMGTTAEDTEKIGDALLKMSENTRTSISSLQEIATVGGQMGVGLDDINSFIGSIDKLNVALGEDFSGGAEEVTVAFSKLRNVFADTQTDDMAQDLLRIGNVVNVLGAEGSATSSVMTDFAGRMSALNQTANMSSSDIFGYSAAMEEMGITAERGSGAMIRFVQQMANDVEGFGSAIGLSGDAFDEFAHRVDYSTNEAIFQFIQGLQDMNLTTSEMASVMDDLGLKGTGTSEILAKFGGNLDLISKRQDQAKDAIGDTNSVLAEFETKNNTRTATIKKVGNTIKASFIGLGKTIAPALDSVVSKIGEIANQISDKFQALPEGTQQSILIIIGSIALLGPVLIGLGALITGVGTVFATLGTIISSVGAVIGFLISPIGLIVIAFAGLIAMFGLVAKKSGTFDKLKDAVVNTFNRIKDTWKNFKDALKNPEVQESIEKVKEAFDKLKEIFKPVIDKFNKFLDKMKGGEGSFFSVEKIIKIIIKTLNIFAKTIKIIIPIIKRFFDIVKFSFIAIGIIIAGFLAVVVGIPVLFISAFRKLMEFAQSLPEKVGGFFVSLWDAIKNVFQFGVEFINEKVELLKEIWNRLPEIANEMAFNIGVAIGNIIKFFIELPSKIKKAIHDFVQMLLINYLVLKEKVTETFKTMIENIINFFIELPENIKNAVVNLGTFLFEKFFEIKTKVIETITELITGIVKAFSDFITNLPETMSNIKNGIVDGFKEILQKALDFGKDLINNMVKGITDNAKKLKDTISNLGSSFTEGVGSVFKSKGGIIQGFKKGGIVKTLYASSGALVPKGTDTVPAMLTPGELVIPRGMTNTLLGMLKQLSSLPSVQSTKNNQGNSGVIFNVETLNARNENEARQSAGDLGFYYNLQTKGF